MDLRTIGPLRYLAGLADQHDNLIMEIRAGGREPDDSIDDMIVPVKICREARDILAASDNKARYQSLSAR